MKSSSIIACQNGFTDYSGNNDDYDYGKPGARAGVGHDDDDDDDDDHCDHNDDYDDHDDDDM